MITYLLIKGDSILKTGTNYPDLKEKYDKLFEEYSKSGGRPPLEPTIWQKVIIVNPVIE